MRKKTNSKSRLNIYRQKKHTKISLWGILIPFIIIGGVIAYVFCTSCYFGGSNRLSVAIQGKDGEIVVSTFDPVAGEVTNVHVPGNTQLTVSRQLGSWKAKSLWRLGENEKLGGSLIQESMIRNFHFPVSAWANESHMGLANGSVGSMIGSLFQIKGSNLEFGDKLRLILFSMGLGNGKRYDVNLEETAYLRKEKLVDGELGYVPTSKIPNNLLVVFGNPEYGKAGIKAGIKDMTGKLYIGQEVGSTLEVLGIKVASVEKNDKSDFDCHVVGKDKTMVAELANIFSCSKTYKDAEGNYNLVIELGERFGKRY